MNLKRQVPTLAFPLAITVIRVMLNLFSGGFKVTLKGTVSDWFSFNWQLALSLLVMFVLSAVSLWICRPGQWRSYCTPGELRSLWLLLKILFKPRILFERKIDIRAITVSQV